jgi:hypothetical protein
MAKWMKMQINLGVSAHGLRVVKKGVVEDTHEPWNPIPESQSTKVYRKPYAPITYVFNTYGLGWRQGYYRGNEILIYLCICLFISNDFALEAASSCQSNLELVNHVPITAGWPNTM